MAIELPRDIWSVILSYCEYPISRRGLCRQWRHAGQEPTVADYRAQISWRIRSMRKRIKRVNAVKASLLEFPEKFNDNPYDMMRRLNMETDQYEDTIDQYQHILSTLTRLDRT